MLFVICDVIDNDCECFCVVFFLMIRQPPRSTRTDTLFPDTTLFRSLIENRRGSIGADISHGQTAAWLVPAGPGRRSSRKNIRSEEHTSELQSLMRNSHAVFCLNKKTTQTKKHHKTLL